MTVKLSPFGPKPQFEGADGLPLSGAKLFFYAAGSSTKQNTYSDSTGASPNANPIILNSRGEPPDQIWFTSGLLYKAVLAPSTDTDPPVNPLWTVDNISGINDTTTSVDEWTDSGLVPTYVSTTSFTVPGDQTSTLHVGRRLKFTVTAGTVYGRITASVFGALTTLTIQMDGSQVLDSGLSAVSLAILRANVLSLPVRAATAAGTDTYTASVGISRYVKDDEFQIKIPNANTSTTPTLNLDSLGAKTIKKDGGAALAAGDMATNGQYTFRYDGTDMILLNPKVSSSGISTPKGRITLTTAVPVTTSDVTGATTVYYTPYNGNTVPIYNGSAFVDTVFTELSQLTTDNTKSPAAVAASKVYDLFVWSDSGTLRCTRGPAWTNDTTPGTGAGTSELQMINGIMTNKVAITNGPGANLGTYVGTIRSDGSSQINDALTLRYVANAYNDVDRPMSVIDTTDTWTYTLLTWRQARAAAGNQLAYVACQLPFTKPVWAEVQAMATNGGAGNIYASVGVGVDSTSVNSAQLMTPASVGNSQSREGVAFSKYKGTPGIGAHTLVWLEECTAGSTSTYYGDNALSGIQSGIQGVMRG